MKLSVSVTNYSWPDRLHDRLASLAGYLDHTAVYHALLAAWSSLSWSTPATPRLVLFAGLDGLPEPTNSRPKRRLPRLVAQTGALVGADALFLRLDVGHAVIPS